LPSEQALTIQMVAEANLIIPALGYLACPLNKKVRKEVIWIANVISASKIQTHLQTMFGSGSIPHLVDLLVNTTDVMQIEMVFYQKYM